MCSTNVMSVVDAETTRRRFLRSIGVAAAGVGATAMGVRAQSRSNVPSRVARTVHFETVIDLTHVLEPGIPNYFRLDMEITPVLTHAEHGVYVNRLSVPEHYGTHFDTPAHFIRRGATGESIGPEQLVGPLVIIDISERASWDPNTEVTVADLEQWEWLNGRIPPGAFVAMYSNWAKRWPTAAYLNEDATRTYNFPGFGADSAQFLIEERDIIGIGCDSHSLDIGPSTHYPAHIAILSAGKIGVENLAGLDEVLRRTERRRQTGDSDQSLIFIGGLKTRGGSGSPVRALALL
jgi:kynurenine formamidase